ncbi:MAG: hypothetical protein V1740_05200 [Candidatus Woesearchaeota archaeon]
MAKEKDKKLKIGFFGITGCAGCLLSFIFNEDDIVDILGLIELKAFPFIKELNPDDSFDYVFLEGLVANNEDLETLNKLRKNTKFLISLGACACTGCVPAYRHFTLKENYEHLMYKKDSRVKDLDPTPIDAHVKVDYFIPGCPPSKDEIIKFIKDILLGKEPKRNQNPVCVECRLNNNQCLLDIHKPCLGPITAGGCNAVCINGGFECWGCRGPTDDMNLDLHIMELKAKGFDKKFILDRMRTFIGLKMPMLESVLNGKDNKPKSHNKD